MLRADRDLPSLPIEDVEKNTKTVISRASSLAIVEAETLTPQDGGKRAWLFLISACVVEGVTMGQSLSVFLTALRLVFLALPYSFGVFRAYFLSHVPFEGLISVSATGMIANVRSLALLMACKLTSARAPGRSQCHS